MTRKIPSVSNDHLDKPSAHSFEAGRFDPANHNESRLAALRGALVEGELSGRAEYTHEALVAELDSDSI